ncbi:MAG: ATP-binding protein, partial [Pseudomonadota bacterium]
LGRMAAGVAHEINNPLAAIGELAGLLDDLIDEDFRKNHPHGTLFKENLIKIQQHVERVRSVTHRLLGFARRMEPRLEKLEVNQVLTEAFSFLEREAKLKGVEVNLELARDLPSLNTDRAQLQQVFLNLLNNALDAVEEGGQLRLGSWQDDGEVVVSVADNGPGIPEDMQDSVFDPFFTTKGPGEGTGLGLSISHSIMQKLGGSITFESLPHQGATFYVHIPIS